QPPPDDRRFISPSPFRPMTQEGKNMSSVVIFTEQFKALAGWRLALMIEGIDAFFSTCRARSPARKAATRSRGPMPQLDAYANLTRDGRLFIMPGPNAKLRGLERALRAAGVSLLLDPV